MSEVLGIAQGWWVVSGLVIDITGFLCLFAEWRRDRKVTWAGFKFNAKELDELWTKKNKLEGRLSDDEAEYARKEKEVEEIERALEIALNVEGSDTQYLESELAKQKAKLNGFDSLIRHNNEQLAHFKKNDMARYTELRELQNMIDPVLHEYLRSIWFFVGVALVVFGFVLQIIGSWKF